MNANKLPQEKTLDQPESPQVETVTAAPDSEAVRGADAMEQFLGMAGTARSFDPEADTVPAASTGATASELSMAPPGYEILSELGRGGMGVVYRALDVRMNRNVAVKLLQTSFPPSSPAARRFVEEAKITGQLQHPGIPPVHQVGKLPDGRPYLVMKLIEGHTLDRLLDERNTAQDNRGHLLAVFEHICQAVGYAHSRSIIHRDLKPANVMVGGFGEVQVMDWGLAKSLVSSPETPMSSPENPRREADLANAQDSATRVGSVLGTPTFMPPEQANGEVAKVDARSDVFSLGAMLCVILTGKPVYEARDTSSAHFKAARWQIADAFTRLDACGAEAELVALTKKCLARARRSTGKRGGSGVDHRGIANAGRGACPDGGTRPRSRGGRTRKAAAEAREQQKRRKVQLALAGAVLLILTGSAAVVWWQDKQAGERRIHEARLDADRAPARHAWKASATPRRAIAPNRQDKEHARTSILPPIFAGNISLRLHKRLSARHPISPSRVVPNWSRKSNKRSATSHLSFSWMTFATANGS